MSKSTSTGGTRQHTEKIRCPNGCRNKFQDREYGDGVRVFIVVLKGSRESPKVSSECTVCGRKL